MFSLVLVQGYSTAVITTVLDIVIQYSLEYALVMSNLKNEIHFK